MENLDTQLNWHVPYLTHELPGIGGTLRTEAEDFIVDEVPAYEPMGTGEHVYVRVEKRNIATLELIKQIAQQLHISRRDIGSAGLKDAHAVARQTLSVHGVSEAEVEALDLDNARVLWVKRHRNKLKAGHLRGNRFTIRIRDVVSDASTRAAAILDALAVYGVPNAYGPQRFGNRGDNHILGYYLLTQNEAGLSSRGIRRLSPRIERLFISAFQSALFNQLLAHRMQEETMHTVILGDVARKEDTGGIFVVEDVAAEAPRAAAWEISATGPIYGYKLMKAQAQAGELESRILAQAGLDLEDFRVVKARGLRRPLRYNPEGATFESDGNGNLVVSFFAPKGSYATVLLAELMKSEGVR